MIKLESKDQKNCGYISYGLLNSAIIISKNNVNNMMINMNNKNTHVK